MANVDWTDGGRVVKKKEAFIDFSGGSSWGRATYRLAKLTGNAPLLSRGVSPERMLTAETRAERALLKGVVNLCEAQGEQGWVERGCSQPLFFKEIESTCAHTARLWNGNPRGTVMK